MKTFTIDTDNNISAFATPAEAAATTTTPFDTFASQKELASLLGPADRQVAIWNSLAGVTPGKKFKNAKAAAAKIWERIQGLGGTAKPKGDAKPKAEAKVKGGTRAVKGAPAKAKATKEPTPAKKAPKPAKG